MAVTDNQEVKGSRRQWEDGKFLYGERLFIADLATDAPATGADFTSTNGETAATTLTELRAVQVSKDPEVIPGIWFIKVLFRAFKAYA